MADATTCVGLRGASPPAKLSAPILFLEIVTRRAPIGARAETEG